MLVICEGLDRTGKTTVANHFESKGYKVIHMSAPPPGQNPDNFLQEMLEIVMSAATQDIFLDRSYYGEFVWPKVYGRKSLLDKDGIEALREIEDQVGTKRIMMIAGNTPEQISAHWDRCVANKEPLDKKQFNSARNLFSLLAREYDFENITLPDFCKEYDIDESTYNPPSHQTPSTQDEQQIAVNVPIDQSQGTQTRNVVHKPLDQRQLLEKANAINDILDKRILKKSGTLYDELENDIRVYLSSKLAAIFGNSGAQPSLTPDEIVFFKAMYKRVLEKEN